MSNLYRNAKVDLTTTNATTLYTCPTAKRAIVKSILVSEDSGNADTITVTITDADSAVFSLFKTKAVSAKRYDRTTYLTVGSGRVRDIKSYCRYC